ncbi:hypothetical protein Tco_1045385 [Tanacetum coccineum]|uniref:Uncharacterized protein n=1 Tax=Tanacetum coccineum TaxID=301880 RepID=A0ABQ5GTQ4_9ASTR
MRARQSAAATVAAACANVRQWLAATVDAAWWRVARAGGFIPTGCCFHHFNAPFVGGQIGNQRPLTYRELELHYVALDNNYYCFNMIIMLSMSFIAGELNMGDMSNSDKLRHTDNTTLVPPRLPDTLPQVYHKRRPTLGLLILPSVLPFPLTIRRTTRISVLPIEPNLAERARISAINLDDYQLDPLTPPPSPLSLFSMAAYQRMIAETDPT